MGTVLKELRKRKGVIMDGMSIMELVGRIAVGVFLVLGFLQLAVPNKKLGRRMFWLCMSNVALGIFFPVVEFWVLMVEVVAFGIWFLYGMWTSFKRMRW